MLPRATADLYRANQRRSTAAMKAVRSLWRGMGGDFDASWARVGPQITRVVAAAQLGAAQDGADAVGLALEQSRTPVDALFEPVVTSLAGVASDGRPLGSLLYGAVTTARTRPESLPVREWTTPQSLARGGKWLDMVVQTQVADAARAGSTLGIVARPKVGYVRMVNPPCCSRCAVLAGRYFKWNTGFQRHPRCDCLHVPVASQAGAKAYSTPIDLDQVTGLNKDERAAIDLGADLAQVVNARRGRSGMTTSEGATLMRGRQRLTPDAIIRLSSDRDEAVALLRRNNYLR